MEKIKNGRVVEARTFINDLHTGNIGSFIAYDINDFTGGEFDASIYFRGCHHEAQFDFYATVPFTKDGKPPLIEEVNRAEKKLDKFEEFVLDFICELRERIRKSREECSSVTIE